MAYVAKRGTENQSTADILNRSSEYWNPGLGTEEEFFTVELLAEFERFSRLGWRALIREKSGHGTIERVRISDGVDVGVSNCTLPAMNREVCEVEEGLIILLASLSSNFVFRVDGHAPLVFDRPELALINVPKGSRLTIDNTGGVRQQRLLGIFRPDKILEVLRLDEESVLPQLRDAARGRGEFGRLTSQLLGEYKTSLLAATIDTPLSGEARALLYEARMLEMAAFAIEGMQNPVNYGGRVQTIRELDFAKRARDQLARKYRCPPDLNSLASELGTNPNKLRAAFKAAYGVTMAEYCRDRRIREAQQLLLQPRLTIAQIAEMVGYQYPSGFAAAFSAHVGMTPRDYRKYRAPVRVERQVARH